MSEGDFEFTELVSYEQSRTTGWSAVTEMIKNAYKDSCLHGIWIFEKRKIANKEALTFVLVSSPGIATLSQDQLLELVQDSMQRTSLAALLVSDRPYLGSLIDNYRVWEKRPIADLNDPGLFFAPIQWPQGLEVSREQVFVFIYSDGDTVGMLRRREREGQIRMALT